LLKNLAGNDVKIFIAPVTPSPNGYKLFNSDYAESLMKVNEALKEYSKDLGFEFIDTGKLLDRQEYFIDNCCHLAKNGAEVVADALVESMVNIKINSTGNKIGVR
jgi:hypothetical protein